MLLIVPGHYSGMDTVTDCEYVILFVERPRVALYFQFYTLESYQALLAIEPIPAGDLRCSPCVYPHLSDAGEIVHIMCFLHQGYNNTNSTM